MRAWIELQVPGSPPGRTWVAEEGGALVGYAEARPLWAVQAERWWDAWVGVLPAERRRGLGSRLLGVAEEHARAHDGRRLEGWTTVAEGLAFAEAAGFRRGREERGLVLELPGPAPAVDEPRAGVDVVPLSELRDRLREVHAVFAEAVADVPADEPEEVGWDGFLAETIADPALDWEASTIVLDCGRPVALALLAVDREGGLAENAMTGTLRSHRRRGLARLAKRESIRRAAALGVRRIVTGSDSENAGMAALNRALGYRPLVTWTQLVRDL